MNASKWAAASLVALAIALSPGVAAADEQSELEKGRNAYYAQQYAEADTRFRELLDPATGTLHEPALIAQARMLWGAVKYAQGKKAEANAIFEKLLLEDPQFEPDPLAFPTDVINAFIDARARIRDKLNAAAQAAARREAERRAREEEEKRRQAERIALLERLATEEKITERHSRWVAMIPFGVGQFQNKKPALGWAFLIAESALLAGAVATVPIYDAQVRDAERANLDRRYSDVNERLAQASVTRAWNNVLVTGFVVTAVLGIAQAQATFVPETVEVKKRQIPDVAARRVRVGVGPGSLLLEGRF